MPAVAADGFAILAGTLLARGLLLALAALTVLPGWAPIGDMFTAIDPALVVLLAVGAGRVGTSTSARDARRAFVVSLSATALGAILGALTPSYDGGAAWSWAAAALSLVSGLGTLLGLSLIARGAVDFGLRPRVARAAVVLLALATLVGAVRVVLHPEALVWSLLAAPLILVGHLLIVGPLRRLASARRAEASAGRLSPEGAAGLRRWGLFELARLILVVLALVAVSMSRRESSVIAIGLALPLGGAVLSAIGLPGLARFSAAAFAAGVRAAATLALPIVALVVAASIISSLIDGLVVGRESALTRAGLAAVEVGFLTYLSLLSAVGAVHRAAKGMSLVRVRRFAAILRAALLGLLVAAVSWPIAQSLSSWRTRELLESLAILLLIVFGLTWILSVVLLLIAGRALAASTPD